MTTTTTEWQIGHLALRPQLVWTMAISSLKIRLMRTFLTVLTITTSTAFLMFLLTMARGENQTQSDLEGWKLMLVLSLLVSAAGVLNTMLMSVTQRYREIGTMKCLGALDGFVLLSVLLEAAILGLVGAVMGVVLGLLISVLLGMLDPGAHLQFDWLPVKILVVFLVGMALTTFGASVPAWIASKMPPMDAMRGEK